MLVAAAFLTSACAAGQHAQTADEKPTLDGTETNIGTMQLRGLAIAAPPVHPYYPEGSPAQVNLVIVNSGQSADRLIGITSSAFTGWSAYDSAKDAQKVLDADDPLAEQPTQSSSAPSSSSGSPGSSASSSTTPTAVPTPTGSTSVSVSPGSRVSFGTPEATGGLIITKFKRAMYPGNSIRVTFSFAEAGSKTISVPIALTNGPNNSVIPGPSATGQEG